MVAKGCILILILVALVIRLSTPIKRGCSPTGYEELHRCEKLWSKRCLILMLLLIAGIESNPGEFIIIIFIAQAALFR